MSEQQPQGMPAVGFLVMAFTEETAADQALEAMKEAKKAQQFYFEDAAVMRQDAHGKVHYHETGDMRTGKGAGIGALVGGVLGILGGPAGMALGAGAGAAIGAAVTHSDKGFRNESLNTVGTALRPGTSAIAVITSRAFLEAVREQVPVDEIRGAVSNLAAHLAARLADGKDVAIGMLLAADGLLVKEIAVDDESAEVVGAVITSDAVLAGAAVITAEGVAYQVAGATAAGMAVETGVVTVEGAEVVDAVALAEPTTTAEETADAPADAGKAAPSA